MSAEPRTEPPAREVIRRIERQWFYAEARDPSGHFAIACLRRLPDALWLELLSVLPPCTACGVHIPPRRADIGSPTCSERCMNRLIGRRHYRRRKAKLAEQTAIAESINQ